MTYVIVRQICNLFIRLLIGVPNDKFTIHTYSMAIFLAKFMNSIFCFIKCSKFHANIQLRWRLYNEYQLS